jgi:hypothetical protein
MDATRIIRAAPATPLPRAEEVTRVLRKAPPAKPPPLLKAAPPAPLPLERLVLVARVLGRERAAELLEGLEESARERAREHLARVVALSSAQRQARVAVEFGVVEDAAQRLRALMDEAPEPLQRELFRRLPPYHRSLFPQRTVEPPDAAVSPGLGTLAERLIREATR